MNRRTIITLGAFGLVAAFEAGEAQMVAAKQPKSPASRPPARTATIPPSPPAQPIVVNTTGLPQFVAPAGSVPSSGAPAHYLPVGIAQVTYYPTLVLSDGRVIANFGTGRGYEQVLRQCPPIHALPSNVIIPPCWTVDAYGNYRVMQRR